MSIIEITIMIATIPCIVAAGVIFYAAIGEIKAALPLAILLTTAITVGVGYLVFHDEVEVTKRDCFVSETSFEGHKWSKVGVVTRQCGSMKYSGDGDMPQEGRVYDITIKGGVGTFREAQK